MIWVGLGQLSGAKGAADTTAINRLGAYGGAMAQSPQGETSPLEADLQTAQLLGKRVAEATARWTKGKP